MKLPRVSRLVVALGIVFFCYVVFVQCFFISHSTGGFARFASRFVAIPAATWHGEALSYRRLTELTQGILAFHPDIDHERAFDQALATGVWRLGVRDLAEELRVGVSEEEVATYAVDEGALAGQFASAKWTVKEYRKYVVEPLLLAQKVEAAVGESEQFQEAAREDMDSVMKKLDQGMPFADVAENFSQDPSALSRGDLGMMRLSEVPSWLLPATFLEPGERSQVLSAPDAYWVVQMIEKYPGEDGAVHFRGIAIRKRIMSTIVDERFAEDPAWVFVW